MTPDIRVTADQHASAGLRRHVAGVLLLAVAVSGLYALLTWRLNVGTGLTETFVQGAGPTPTIRIERRTRAVDLTILEDDRHLPRRFFTVRWTGIWYIPTGGLYDLALSADGRATWTIDGHVAQEDSTARRASNSRTVSLDAGFHPIEVEYEQNSGTPALRVAWAPVGGALRSLDPEHLFPTPPVHPRLRAVLDAIRGGFRWLGVAGLAVSVWIGLLSLLKSAFGLGARLPGPSGTHATGRTFAVVLLVLVVGYASALRFEALTAKYGSVQRPAWLHALQEHARAPLRVLTPASVRWNPVPNYPHRDGQWTRYISDPYTYLEYARQMRSFYAAHYREPVFPFVTKIFLRLLDDQDMAVSFASASFSVLAVLATYLLGSYAFSRWVGLGAALAMAIEYDVISSGVDGWRDDAFTCAVVMSAYAMLRYSRVPSRGNALLMGALAGAACLIRITSLSFLLPGFMYVLVTTRRPWRERASGIGLGAFTMTAIVAPYMFNCWLVFGDPLYAINYHTSAYLATEGLAVEPRPSAVKYVETRLLSRPYRTVDTVALGLTSYPFLNKWRGFDPWVSTLGTWLSRAALFGLLLLAASTSGRLLLLLLLASLVPYAVTWRLISDWRFTQHAYPFLLIASCAALGQLLTWAAPWRIIGLLTQPARAIRPRAVVFWMVILGGLGAGSWTIRRALPVLTVRESLLANEPVTIMAGERDASFFGEGWSAPVTAGNVTSRVSRGPYSIVWVPLPRVADYGLTVRVDPFPRPLRDAAARLPVLRVFLNGSFVGDLELGWNPERVGAYEIELSRTVVKEGFNRLALLIDASSVAPAVDDLTPEAGISDGAACKLWYVRVRPHAVRAQ